MKVNGQKGENGTTTIRPLMFESIIEDFFPEFDLPNYIPLSKNGHTCTHSGGCKSRNLQCIADSPKKTCWFWILTCIAVKKFYFLHHSNGVEWCYAIIV